MQRLNVREIDVAELLYINSNVKPLCSNSDELQAKRFLWLPAQGRIVEWIWPQLCPECDGVGILLAEGNTNSFQVKCPECYGYSTKLSPGRFVYTDIDGRLLFEFESAIDSGNHRNDLFWSPS